LRAGKRVRILAGPLRILAGPLRILAGPLRILAGHPGRTWPRDAGPWPGPGPGETIPKEKP